MVVVCFNKICKDSIKEVFWELVLVDFNVIGIVVNVIIFMFGGYGYYYGCYYNNCYYDC